MYEAGVTVAAAYPETPRTEILENTFKYKEIYSEWAPNEKITRTQVRYGEKVFSPIIGNGQAEIIVAFGKMEILSSLDYLMRNGKVVINDFEIPSLPVLTGVAQYPKDVIENVNNTIKNKVILVKAGSLAKEFGDLKRQNIIMTGALIKALGHENIDWESVIK